MKKAAGIVFFLLFFLFFLATGVLCLNNAPKISFWNPSEGAEAGDAWLNRWLPARVRLLAPSRLWNASLDKRYYPEISCYIADSGQSLPTSRSSTVHLPIEQLTQLRDYCSRRGMQFLYVLFPGKPCTDEELLELGFACNRNEASDLLAQALRQRQIPVLDLRERFRCEPEYYDYFYKTEHHWTADAGVLAAQEIVDRLNGEFSLGLAADRIADGQLGRQVYPGIFVGEHGSKTLGRYGQRDDFIVRRPLYTPHLRYLCPETGADQSGGFDVLTNEAALSENHLDGGRSLYYYYLFENNGLVEIRDADVTDGDLFLIKDSFANVVTPFLSLCARRVTTWDMRSDNRVFDYLDAHPEIDTVIVAYSPSFQFNSKMNDFQ